VCFLSLRGQALRADGVPPTMTRLSKALGYPSFRALQDDFRATIAWGSVDFAARAKRLQRRARRGPVTDQLTHLQMSNIETLATLNPPDQFERVAKMLLKARTTAFLGFRRCHSIALHAHYLYSMLICRGVLLQDAYGTLLEAVAGLDRSDTLVALDLAPYSRQTVDAVRRAQAQGITIVALTDSELSPLARGGAERLLFEPASSSFFHSLVAAHALVERLMHEVATRGGRKVVARLHSRATLLRDAGAYWQRDPSSRR
jgi:DNA-binding MurR/RpiR family transcriptional regulator